MNGVEKNGSIGVCVCVNVGMREYVSGVVFIEFLMFHVCVCMPLVYYFVSLWCGTNASWLGDEWPSLMGINKT